ncbi:recombinase family protein [Sulfitobacter dubius]|uniref:recombinase family protein n=1 Tax=Sulfitobacter dubius TaxID=218673 RepID=UPI0022AEB955|nr:recombinase family protein [Sulfitobacter dubius]MCZ4367542.1 recombinase family protein [Sulfitobacter dubius]
MPQYVIYRRVSTAEQGRSGHGLDAQNRDIRLYLENYSAEPFEILGEFEDHLSGKNADRPELAKALEIVRANGAELLVSKLDRLSRDVAFIATLLKDKRTKLRVASMPNADNFQLHIYAALAEQERDFISARTKAALAEAKNKGAKLGGLRDATMQRNIAVQANAKARADKVAQTVLPLRASGATLRDIADALNKSGVETARGGKWQPSQVQRVLKRLAS